MPASAVFFLAALAALISASAQANARPWPHFVVQRNQASPDREERQVSLLVKIGPESSKQQPSFWVLERWVSYRRGRERGTIHEWVDARTCPALNKVVAAISHLPTVKFDADAQIRIAPFHHAVTTLYGPPSNDPGGAVIRISRSDYAGGVTAWWANSEASLQSCWRSEPPSLEDAPLPTLLGTPEAADRWARPYW